MGRFQMTDSRAFDLSGKRIFVAGHRGMVGSAVVRRLEREDCEILTASRDRLDLTRQDAVEDWIAEQRPDAVVLAAAKVGGIMANQTLPGSFIYDNLAIEANIIEAARRFDVRKLLFLGSSCIYPRLAPQPMKEEHLLTGALEPTNEWYAIAKIAGLKMCQAFRRQYGCDFISAMPTNLYGPGDNFDLETSHVVPALLRKADMARQSGARSMVVWGTGKPRREFLHVDDLADALVFLLVNYSDEGPVNIGAGEDISIADLSYLVCRIVGFEGGLEFDVSKPDGTPRKLLDVSRLSELGWTPGIPLETGLADTYEWLKSHQREIA
jgi:GDP-L-fucose synthase